MHARRDPKGFQTNDGVARGTLQRQWTCRVFSLWTRPIWAADIHKALLLWLGRCSSDERDGIVDSPTRPPRWMQVSSTYGERDLEKRKFKWREMSPRSSPPLLLTSDFQEGTITAIPNTFKRCTESSRGIQVQ